MSDLSIRNKNRLENYDYSTAGKYFITICTRDRCNTLAEIFIGDTVKAVLQTKDCAGALVVLSKTGKIVDEFIKNIHKTTIAVMEKYVIMPNHVHLLICLNTEASVGTPAQFRNRETVLTASPTQMAIPKILNSFKGLTSKKVGKSIWQRSYYDHVIRSEEDYQRVWEYIDENPSKWIDDEYYRNT